MCDLHKCEILLSDRRLTDNAISTEPCYSKKNSDGSCSLGASKKSIHNCLTPTNAQNLSGRSSSLTPSEMIGDKVKLFSFPWRRRSTSFNITPKWAFRRFRYVQTSCSRPHLLPLLRQLLPNLLLHLN
jgi:hypothetical protein